MTCHHYTKGGCYIYCGLPGFGPYALPCRSHGDTNDCERTDIDCPDGSQEVVSHSTHDMEENLKRKLNDNLRSVFE